jgi:multicomponent Na+:H+ antiporter subunit C
MTFLLAVAIGVLYAAAVYMLLRRSIAKLLIGIALLGHATNLLVFVAGGSTRLALPPVLPEEQVAPESEPPRTKAVLAPPFVLPRTPIDKAAYADPLPQAMVLTAIVISFGFLAFVVTLLSRNAGHLTSDDVDEMRGTEGTE